MYIVLITSIDKRCLKELFYFIHINIMRYGNIVFRLPLTLVNFYKLKVKLVLLTVHMILFSVFCLNFVPISFTNRLIMIAMYISLVRQAIYDIVVLALFGMLMFDLFCLFVWFGFNSYCLQSTLHSIHMQTSKQ